MRCALQINLGTFQTAVQLYSCTGTVQLYSTARTDGPIMEDDLSMGTEEYSFGGGYEDDDY